MESTRLTGALPAAKRKPQLDLSCISNVIRMMKQGMEILFLLLLASLFIFPFLWMISTSFKSLVETMYFPPTLLPERFTLEYYVAAWQSSNFFRAAVNSLAVAVLILALQLLFILPAAYAFAFKSSRLHKPLFGLIMIGLMIPEQVTFLPVYLMFSRLGLINSYIPLVIPFAASAFGTFMITQSFRQIPMDVIEAARLDKAGTVKIIRRILLPSIRPTVIVFSLFSFISHWNDYFWPFAMTNQETLRTLPMAVARLTSVDGVKPWNMMMAGNVILVAPLLIIYIFCSKWIKRAFAYSGIK